MIVKKIIAPERFNLVRNVERLQGKITLKEFLRKRGPESIGIIVCTALSILFNLGFGSALCISAYTVFLVAREKFKNKEIAKRNLDHSMIVDGYTELLEDFELKDCKDAVVYSKEPKEESWWLLDGMGRVDNKKVVSYIAIPKKYKLIVFKQILNRCRYENEKLEDAFYTQMFLLEEEDLIKERIVTEDGYLNERSPVAKQLLNTKYYK